MKIAIIGDIHFGARNDSQFFIDYQVEYFNNKFFPYLIQNNIKHIIFLGDMFDKRKYINFKTLNHIRTNFIQPLIDNDIHCHAIVGNHDLYYKNATWLNSYNELIGKDHDSFTIYDKPTEIELDNISFLMVPWLSTDTEKDWIEIISKSQANVCCGHFEINGFDIMKGITTESGCKINTFSNFDKVFSGHYHLPSSKNHITYVGSPYQLTWSDYEDNKRIIIFDTSTKLEENVFFDDNQLFVKLYYNENEECDLTVLEGNQKIVKLIVAERTDMYKFDLFYENIIRKYNPLTVDVIENNIYNDMILEDAEVMEKDTIDIIKDSIDQRVFEQVDSTSLKILMSEIYTEATKMRTITE